MSYSIVMKKLGAASAALSVLLGLSACIIGKETDSKGGTVVKATQEGDFEYTIARLCNSIFCDPTDPSTVTFDTSALDTLNLATIRTELQNNGVQLSRDSFYIEELTLTIDPSSAGFVTANPGAWVAGYIEGEFWTIGGTPNPMWIVSIYGDSATLSTNMRLEFNRHLTPNASGYPAFLAAINNPNLAELVLLGSVNVGGLAQTGTLKMHYKVTVSAKIRI